MHNFLICSFYCFFFLGRFLPFSCRLLGRGRCYCLVIGKFWSLLHYMYSLSSIAKCMLIILALNLTDKIRWLQKKNFSLCFSFYFIFRCFELFEILVTSNDCGLKLFLEKKNCQANLKYLMLKKDHLSTDINWLLIYFPRRSGWYLCNSIS